jgi:hypothetical protein
VLISGIEAFLTWENHKGLEINSQEQMMLLITICKGGNLQANWYNELV